MKSARKINYKHILIKMKRFLTDPRIRFSYLTVLGFTHFMSDKFFLKKKYNLIFGKKLNLENPVTFNEKIQWLKINDRKPEYTKMVDKYEAKKYVASIVGEEYIIPTLGVWNKFEEIDFSKMPQQFVLKCTHDSGGLVICRDKDCFNVEEARKKIEKSLKSNYFWSGREWPYKNVPPRIIAEEYITDISAQKKDSKDGITDYKFFCFWGEPQFLYVSKGLEEHSTARISFLSMDWEFAPFKRADYQNFEVLPEKPKGFEQMVQLCRNLSKEIPFLRVDLYQSEDKIYFSELTFFPCSGFIPFEREQDDYEIGNMLKLPN